MSADAVLELARSIDAPRASALERESARSPGAELGVLLETAFPPLAPRHGWQHQALTAIAARGWDVPARRARIRADLEAATGDLADPSAASRLRRAVWAAKARIALRELIPPALGGADVDVAARELSFVAEAAFEIALAEAEAYETRRAGPPLRADGEQSSLVVLGMGKLGGLELNAGSDVDVLFVYDTDEGADGVDLHDYWTRVTRRLVRTLEEQTADPFIWRVDLRLRPEGSRGPMVNSVAATERYYETWGRLWERAALLRSRAIAGDAALGELIDHEVVRPFVYRREVDPNVATWMAEMVQRSRDELSDDPSRDLKLGPGGIREAEFFIQSLQLIWGGREPSLRVPGSLAALARLKGRGLVTDLEEEQIASAYLLLRRLEHRVQWYTGVQTHLLPTGDDLARIGRSLGYGDPDDLLDQLARARETVEAHFAGLAPEAPRPPPRYHSVLGALQRGDAEDLDAAVERAFAADLGEHLEALARRPDGVLGRNTLDSFPDFGDRVLDMLAESADPEQATRYLRSLFGRFVSPEAYVARLAQDERALARLLTVLGASCFVGDSLVSRPDLADQVVFSEESVHGELARELVMAELDTYERRARALDDPDDRRDALLGALRSAKAKVMVAIAVADLSGEIQTRDATRTLSALADEILDRTVRFEHDGPGLLVVAMGKLGGSAIGYGSDLDVLFIYDPDAAPDGSDPAEYFARKAQRIIRVVSMPHPAGPGYELDTRLRPSGSQGLLVTSLEAFARYHGLPVDQDSSHSMQPTSVSTGAAWERQALLRARPCAGDRELGDRFMQLAHRAAYEMGAPPAEEVHHLRTRMERELAQERPGRRDLKMGEGGLLDIEFAVQWLQMRHGAEARVRTPETLEALEALHDLGHLPTRDYESFRAGRLFLRRLEQRIHVVHGVGSSVVDTAATDLRPLARRMDLRDTARSTAVEVLIAHVEEVTRSVRQAYLRVLGVGS